MPGLPEGILGSLLSTGGLGLLIFFLWRSVNELKQERSAAWAQLDLDRAATKKQMEAERTQSSERLSVISAAHELARREQEAAHKATLNKLERDHVTTIQALAEAKDAEIAILQEALLDETRRRLQDKADYERQFTATAERIERLLLEWRADH